MKEKNLCTRVYKVQLLSSNFSQVDAKTLAKQVNWVGLWSLPFKAHSNNNHKI